MYSETVTFSPTLPLRHQNKLIEHTILWEVGAKEKLSICLPCRRVYYFSLVILTTSVQFFQGFKNQGNRISYPAEISYITLFFANRPIHWTNIVQNKLKHFSFQVKTPRWRWIFMYVEFPKQLYNINNMFNTRMCVCICVYTCTLRSRCKTRSQLMNQPTQKTYVVYIIINIY